MALLGLLAFFQITFIPGYIFLNILKLQKGNKLQTIVYSFSLSLLINYFLIYFFTLINCYKPCVIYTILTVEIIYLIYFIMKRRIHFYVTLNTSTLESNLFFTTAVLITTVFFYFFISNTNAVFNNWDPAFSWNMWAIDWYLNEIPSLTNLYPQLIPSNWSLTYMMMQTHHIQLFAKLIMPLFAILTLFLFLNLYLKKKNITYLSALIIYVVILLNYALAFIKTGYVDIAVSFFSLLTLYAILNTKEDTTNIKDVILIILFSSAAALTKQIGWYIFIISIGWIISNLVKNRKKTTKTNISLAVSMLVLIVLMTSSWYIVKIIEINKGLDFSNILFLTHDIYHGAAFIERFITGSGSLQGGTWFFVLLLLLAAISFFNKKSRWVSITITFPLVLLWGFFFSYDRRNLIPSIPFIAYSCAFGISFIHDRFLKRRIKGTGSIKDLRLNKLSLVSFIVFNVAIAAVGFTIILNKNIQNSLIIWTSNIKGKPVGQFWNAQLIDLAVIIVLASIFMTIFYIYLILKKKLPYKNFHVKLSGKQVLTAFLVIMVSASIVSYFYTGRLTSQQIEKQKLLGSPTINNLLYRYKDEHEIGGKIITDYYWATILPGFEDQGSKIFKENSNFVILSNSDKIPLVNPLGLIDDASYLLISDMYYNSKYSQQIQGKLTSGDLTLMFHKLGYHFLKINK